MRNKGYNNLTQLKNDIQKCKKCELYKSRKKAVKWNGPKKANVILKPIISRHFLGTQKF